MKWDPKSRNDVDNAAEGLRKLSARIDAALSKTTPDAALLRALFDEVEHIGQVGSMAASWCED